MYTSATMIGFLGHVHFRVDDDEDQTDANIRYANWAHKERPPRMLGLPGTASMRWLAPHDRGTTRTHSGLDAEDDDVSL